MRKTLEAIYVWARLTPEQPAIILHDRLITYRMLASGIMSVEGKIKSLGLDRSKPVGVCIESPARHLIVTFALAKAGYTSVSLEPDGCRFASTLKVESLLADGRLAAVGLIPIIVTEDWFTSPSSPAEWRIADTDQQRIVRLALTSGSTGLPKAIGFTDDVITGRLCNVRGQITAAHERTLIVFGLTGYVGFACALNALTFGRTAVFPRSIEDSVNLIRSSAISCIVASTGHMQDMLRFNAQKCSGSVLPSVTSIITGGSYMPLRLLDGLRSVFRCEIYQLYASTEAGVSGVNNISLIAGADGLTNRYVVCEEVRIENGDGETEDMGVIAVRSTYMAHPFDGSLSTKDGESFAWFRSGDIGYIEPDGSLVVTGRRDDLINIGGVKRSVEFFESHFSQSPLVRDCAITRIDTATGPSIVLLVQFEGRPDAAAIEAWGIKHPLRIEVDKIVRVDSIPRNAMGKVERARVREMASSQVPPVTIN